MDKFEPFDKIEWCGYKWIKRPFWGDNHPDEKILGLTRIVQKLMAIIT